MGKRSKQLIWLLAVLSCAGLLGGFALHHLNKGEAVELSAHIEVGEPVVIPSAKGKLIGSYFPPPGAGNSPAVVLVNGSGRTSYRTAWDPEKERYFWKPVTELLNEAGYAVLLMEKRGINGSEGHWERETFEDRADNVLAAVKHLKGLDGIDPQRIGLMGHSQGGWIVQLAAARKPGDISFIVNLAGPSVSVQEQIVDDYAGELFCQGVANETIQKKVETRHKLLSLYSTVSRFVKTGYLSRIIDYDPAPVTRSLAVPMFSIYADLDQLVPPDKNIQSLLAGLREAGNDQSVVYRIPDANHHFFPSAFCYERSEMKDKEPSEHLLMAISDFIAWEREIHRAAQYPDGE